MSYVKIWVHIVFTTKNREPYLKKDIRKRVYEHIKSNCKKKGIFLKRIGGYTEHVHCLVSLGKSQDVSTVAQLIKGESSFWINQNKLTAHRFLWQDDYFAVSISHSQLQKVCDYIDNQESHHSVKPFSEEIEEFLRKYGFEK